MNIAKLNKELEDYIKQHFFDADDYLREKIYSCIHNYYYHQVEIDDPIVTDLFAIIDRNIEALKREIIDHLKHNAQQRKSLAALKGFLFRVWEVRIRIFLPTRIRKKVLGL